MKSRLRSGPTDDFLQDEAENPSQRRAPLEQRVSERRRRTLLVAVS